MISHYYGYVKYIAGIANPCGIYVPVSGDSSDPSISVAQIFRSVIAKKMEIWYNSNEIIKIR